MPRKINVFDSSAFIAGLNPSTLEGKSYSTPQVLSELKDIRSSSYAESSLEAGLLTIIDPGETLMETVNEKVEKEDLSMLSEADKSVIALALKFKEEGAEVTVYSDDQTIQSVCLKLGLNWKGIRRPGIQKPFKWRFKCPACKRKFREKLSYCPVCGAELKPVRTGYPAR